jgi:hypothetical protein
MFEVTIRKAVSTAVTGDFCYKVWNVEACSRGNAQTLLLEAVYPTQSAQGRLIKGLQNRWDQIYPRSYAGFGAYPNI